MSPGSSQQTRILQIKRIRGIALQHPNLPRSPALPAEAAESVPSVAEVPFPARGVAEACGKAVAYAVAADARPVRAAMGLEKMLLPEILADTVEVQEPIPAKCVAAPVENPVASATARELCPMTVSCATVARHVLPAEGQERSRTGEITCETYEKTIDSNDVSFHGD